MYTSLVFKSQTVKYPGLTLDCHLTSAALRIKAKRLALNTRLHMLKTLIFNNHKQTKVKTSNLQINQVHVNLWSSTLGKCKKIKFKSNSNLKNKSLCQVTNAPFYIFNLNSSFKYKNQNHAQRSYYILQKISY